MSTGAPPIAVGILEDDPATREYLAQLLRTAEGISVAFACASIADARLAIKTASADICLVDIKLPDGNGLDFIRQFGAATGGRSLILTVLGDKASVLLAFEFGASGYLLKEIDLNIADMDRQYYAQHSLTLAKHPSETDERVMEIGRAHV